MSGGRRATGCSRFEEAISARIDGEDPAMSAEVLDSHLERCEHCRAFQRVATAQHRRIRVRTADHVPDLTPTILAAIPDGPAPRPPRFVLGNRALGVPQVAAIAAAIVAVLVGGFVIGGRIGAGRSQSPAAVGGGSGVAVRQVVGSDQSNPAYPGATVLPSGGVVRKPRIVLTDTGGGRYNVAAATAHRVTLLYFGYTHCPDVCPINMALTAAAIHDLPARMRKDVTVVFITTDPTRDTPSVIRAWLASFTGAYRGDPLFVGLTGPQSTIHSAERQVGMPLSYAQRIDGSKGAYDVVHAGYTLVYSQDGLAHISIDETETPREYATTLQHLITNGFHST